MIIASIAFYVFAAILLVSAAMVVTARNPVHSVLFLILAFFNAAALFLIAGAEFLAMILVIVYVGAVAVLFLFVVMMLDIDFAELREGFQRYAPVGATVGLILLIELGLALTGWKIAPEAATLRLSPSGSVANTVALGRVLYTDYVLLFQTAGLVLLVAMIGAIVLTLRDRHVGAAAEHCGAERAHHRGDARTGRCAARRRHPRARHPPAASAGAGEGTAARLRVGIGGALSMAVGLDHYLAVAAILLVLGIFGIFMNRKNVIIILMSIELILLAVNINLVAFSAALGDLAGQVLALFVLTVAAAEAAIGLAIVVIYFRNRGSIQVEDVNLMKG